MAHAVAALHAGMCSVALLVYGSTARSDLKRRRLRDYTPAPRGPAQFEAPYGLTLVGKYALAARRHMHEYGTTRRQLAAVAVAMNQWAQMNPKAFHYGKPLSVDEALKTRMIADPLRQADCCLRTDGGGAVILTTAERARDLRRKPVQVLGTGEAVSHLHMTQWSDMPDLVAAQSGRRALQQAGITPQDVDVLQVYDAFTIMVLLTLGSPGLLRPWGERPVGGERRTRPRWRAADQHGRWRLGLQSAGDARCVPAHRSDTTATRRVWRAPGAGRAGRAV